MNAFTAPSIALLVLLIIANGAPVIASLVVNRWNLPVDGGRTFRDGRPWLGPRKTFCGIFAALLFTPLAALALGFSFVSGILVAGGAMLGDLVSSFIKRRLDIPPHRSCLGLDQIPESLFPLLLVQPILNLSVASMVEVLLAFFLVEWVLTRALDRLR